jgi:uncharacterized protein (DUF1697 family)
MPMVAKRAASSAQIYVALLRGVNMAGNNKLRKQDLVSVFEDAGCRNVRTYIQTGNVLFEAGERLTRQIPATVERMIEQRFRLIVPVLTRTAQELRSISESNPFLGKGAEEKRLCVMFLKEKPEAARLARLDPHRSPPDRYVVSGREIYMWCPEGFARTKFTNTYFDRVLGTMSTGRGWGTVLKLVELTGED